MSKHSTHSSGLQTSVNSSPRPYEDRDSRSSEDTLFSQGDSEKTLIQPTTMENPSDRKRSFGIGGAGNIRTIYTLMIPL